MILSTVMERGMKAVLLFYCLASGKKQKLNCILTSTKSRTWLVSLFKKFLGSISFYTGVLKSS